MGQKSKRKDSTRIEMNRGNEPKFEEIENINDSVTDYSYRFGTRKTLS